MAPYKENALDIANKAIGDMSKEIVELSNMNNELNDRIFELQDQAFKYMRMTVSFEEWLNLHR